MKAVIWDNDETNNRQLAQMLTEEYGFHVHCFREADECSSYLLENKTDLIFLAAYVGMGMYRSVLSKIRETKSEAVICLIGKNNRDSAKVYTNKCDLFLKKPYQTEELREIMKVFSLLSRRLKSVRVRTFGCFGVFVNEMPVNFGSAKAKELFALCVDHRGSTVTIEEAIDKLWPGRECDEKSKRLYRKAVMMINRTLNERKITDVFHCVRGGCMIRPDGIDCDYYRFVEDPVRNRQIFSGKYLIDYDWSEETLGSLTRLALSADPNDCEYLV